jgi:hypothetical protein
MTNKEARAKTEATASARATADPCGMTNKEAKEKAKAED